jgi:hypothetical protein
MSRRVTRGGAQHAVRDFSARRTARRDELSELSELTDVVLRAHGPATTPVDRAQPTEHRRGVLSTYGAGPAEGRSPSHTDAVKVPLSIECGQQTVDRRLMTGRSTRLREQVIDHLHAPQAQRGPAPSSGA